MSDGYVMGRTSAEAARLQLQADILAPHSDHLLRMAGIRPGMRVLDLGCGAGDMTMQIADLVGSDGEVVGVDMKPDILELARERTAAAGLRNVSYQEADVPGLRLDEPVDALVGRLILLHLKDPAAAVRGLVRAVHPGGLVSFQEFDMTRARSVPSTPSATQAMRWIVDGLSAGGLDPDLGERVSQVLRDAGLSVWGAAVAGPAGGSDSGMPEYVAGTVRTVLPILVAHHLATEAEVDIETLADRIARELQESGAVFWSPELAAAWARVP